MRTFSALFFWVFVAIFTHVYAFEDSISNDSNILVENDSLTLDAVEEASVEEQSDSISQKKSFFHRILNQTKPVTYLVFPLVSYTPETNLMLGVGGIASFRVKQDTNTAPSFVIPWFTYSIDKQMVAEVFGSVFYKGTKHQVDYELNYKVQKVPFYGIGNRLDFDNKELVKMNALRFLGAYQNRIKDVFLIGPVYNVDYTFDLEPEKDKIMDTLDIPGEKGGLSHGLGLRMAFDNRDDVFFPYKGNYFSVQGVGYPTWIGSKYQFATVQAEYKSFLNIKRKVILASQILAQMSFGNVPFYMMPRLGGDKIHRGFTAGTHRDKFLFYTQGELRVPLDRFILSGFFGSGIVGKEFMDYFHVKDYTYSIGAGARFRPFKDKNIVARLDVGFWAKTYGIYFVFNEAF